MDRRNRSTSPTAVKIKSYKIRRAGARGLILTLPVVWADDLGLKPGDSLAVFRDTENRLIIEARPSA